MMGQPKPLASLSSGLLARKGQARPAMRPQGFAGFGPFTESMDDLGWNDMGHGDQVAPAVSPVLPAMLPIVEDIPLAPVGVPPVLREREALEEEFAAEDTTHVEPAPIVEQLRTAKRNRARKSSATSVASSVATPRAKAAFTLRLDYERHLRLRLASALRRQSAQQLVTSALDALLRSMPEVEAMATGIDRSDDHLPEIGG